MSAPGWLEAARQSARGRVDMSVELYDLLEQMGEALRRIRQYAGDEGAREWPDDPLFDAHCEAADAALAAYEKGPQ